MKILLTILIKLNSYKAIAIVKYLRLRNNTYLDERRDKASGRTEWQGLVEKLGATGEMNDSNESTTEAED